MGKCSSANRPYSAGDTGTWELTMIEIVLSVCLVQDPAKCKDVNLNFMGDSITAQACMFKGQVAISRWSEGHPNWRITKWRCGIAKQMAKA